MGLQTWIKLDNIDITVGNKPKTMKTDEILSFNSQTLDNVDNIDTTVIGNKPETIQTDQVLITNSQTTLKFLILQRKKN